MADTDGENARREAGVQILEAVSAAYPAGSAERLLLLRAARALAFAETRHRGEFERFLQESHCPLSPEERDRLRKFGIGC